MVLKEIRAVLGGAQSENLWWWKPWESGENHVIPVLLADSKLHPSEIRLLN